MNSLSQPFARLAASRHADKAGASIVTRDHAEQHPAWANADHRWSATRGDYDLGSLMGLGHTEEEATADLLEQEDDLLESLKFRAQSGDRLAQIALKNMGETL